MSRFEPELYERALAALGLGPVTAPDGLDFRETAVAQAVELCKRFEGLSLVPYLCPAGIPTIGYGATAYLNGRRVRLGDPAISQETAERLLLVSVSKIYMPIIERLCGDAVDTPGRLAALTDFAFNLGESNFRGSTLRRRVLAGDWDSVPDELRKWIIANGRPMRGLQRRREAECQLI